MPLHRVDLELVAALAAGDARARQRFAERMQCVPRFVASHARRLGLEFTPEQAKAFAEDALATVCARLAQYRGEITLEGAAGRVVARLLEERSGRAPEARQAAVLAGLERIAPGEARVLRARHFDGIPVDGLALRLGLTQELTSRVYGDGLARLQAELAGSGTPAGARTVLTLEEHAQLERWTSGEGTVDAERLARNPELATALAERQALQRDLDAAGAAERTWFQLAGRDPAGPQAVAWVAESIESLLSPVSGSASVRRASRGKLVALVLIVAIVALTLLRRCV